MRHFIVDRLKRRIMGNWLSVSQQMNRMKENKMEEGEKNDILHIALIDIEDA